MADQGRLRAAKETAPGDGPARDPGAVDRGNGRGGRGAERRVISANRHRTARPSRRGPGDPVNHQRVRSRDRPPAAGAGAKSLTNPTSCGHRRFVIVRKSVDR